jgi:glycosidase
MNLILDFVPNHVAPDHPWVTQHSAYFIRVDAQDAKNDPASYVEVSGIVYACGRDPYFPAWPDVLQLNAFEPGLRQAVKETIAGIAEQCDGIRCDMAMLLVNAIFERTWGIRAGHRPESEYWSEVIPSIKKKHPGFLFIAEAYWDMEWELQQQGFDFCYDKKLYDRLEHGSAEGIRQHLWADLAYQNKLLRFLENHDEPRAASTFSPEKQRAAAVITNTLPGSRLFHEGQFDGRKVRVPVFLRRRPQEVVDQQLQEFYANLLKAMNQPVFREGQWTLCERSGWPENASFQNLVAWSWHKGGERFLVGVNFSDSPLQARLQVPWPDVDGGIWHLVDVLTGSKYDRNGDEMRSPGLYVDLKPWSYHFFRCSRKR